MFRLFKALSHPPPLKITNSATCVCDIFSVRGLETQLRSLPNQQSSYRSCNLFKRQAHTSGGWRVWRMWGGVINCVYVKASGRGSKDKVAVLKTEAHWLLLKVSFKIEDLLFFHLGCLVAFDVQIHETKALKVFEIKEKAEHSQNGLRRRGNSQLLGRNFCLVHTAACWFYGASPRAQSSNSEVLNGWP